ncbi:hypothetical protein DPEC_G00103640 [Dallia pectoralis]|uniref:Uncharacterized protein n=1 Tax=Dallia pectoralis TaxID=75939 RepID=A0ACC2GX42_DALPE|nr:hypothetical protein DPEC_G00103640 [Dallia pectoralis]
MKELPFARCHVVVLDSVSSTGRPMLSWLPRFYQPVWEAFTPHEAYTRTRAKVQLDLLLTHSSPYMLALLYTCPRSPFSFPVC